MYLNIETWLLFVPPYQQFLVTRLGHMQQFPDID